VIEQIRIVDAAADMRAEALVVECMALVPHLQWLSESRLIRATHGVITNAREDHLDVMGPTERDVAAGALGDGTRSRQAVHRRARPFGSVRGRSGRSAHELIAVGPQETERIRPRPGRLQLRRACGECGARLAGLFRPGHWTLRGTAGHVAGQARSGRHDGPRNAFLRPEHQFRQRLCRQ